MSGTTTCIGGAIDDGRRTTDDASRPLSSVLCPPSSVLCPLSSAGRILPAVLWLLLFTASPVWSVEVGEPLPDFALQTFDGSRLSRASLAGKPLLVVFWNTWCPNCMRELPRINRLAEEFSPRGMVVLAINTAINDSEGKARAYWQKSAYLFPTGYDHDFELGQAFGVRGVPTIYLVDAKGVVRYKHPLLPEDMEARFRKLTLD